MLTFRRLICLCAITMLGFSTGCEGEKPLAGSTPPPPPAAGEAPPARAYDYTQKTLESTQRRAGRKWTVAILRFGDTKEVEGVPFGPASQPAQPGGGQVNVTVKIGDNRPAQPVETPPQMNKRAREALKNELVKSEAFTVVERERILDILREINFGKGKYVNPDTAGDEGAILSVKYLIEGSLGLNEDKTLKGNLDSDRSYKDAGDSPPGMFENVFHPGKVNREKMMGAIRQMQQERANNRARAEFNISCYLSVYNVHTGEVVTTVMGQGSNGTEAIADAVEDLISNLSTLDTDIHVAGVGEDKIYLDTGSNGGVKVGSHFQVVHQGQAIRDRDGQLIGYEEKEVGEVEVTEIKPLMCIAKVVNKAGDVARGDLAKPAKH